MRQAPWLTLTWIGFLGGCFGSFMNVVVYRLPAGKSLLHPGSHCPACEHPIRWYDNLPVIGWLRLHGRCRDCQQTISRRYPIVEAVVIGLFVSQWLDDVHGLPSSQPLGPALFAFVWHVSLLCVLICVALVEFDGHITPRSLIIFGTVIPLAMTLLSSRSAAEVLKADEASRVWESVLGGAGLAAAITFIIKPTVRRRRQKRTATPQDHPWTAVALSAMSGLYLGPERAATTLLLATLLWRVLPLIHARSTGVTPWSWYLAALCWVAIMF